MAHVATRRFTYWGQLGILMLLMGVGLLVGQGIDLLILVSKFPALLSDPEKTMNQILVPENADILRLTQLIAVLLMFVAPAIIYGRICHRKPLVHLGLAKNVFIPQVVIAVFLILAALPLVGAFRELTQHLPLGDYIRKKIAASKEEYSKTIMAIAVMRSFGEYLLTLFIVAILPGFAEELFFRGAVQNLFTRWFKNPAAAILLSAFIFSLFHFEYSDFIGRFFLGIVLGWVFYLTGNLWLNICMHAAFNGLSVTGLYLSLRSGGKLDTKDVEDHFNIYFTAGAVAILLLLAYYFYKLNKSRNAATPGEEIMLPGYTNPRDPFTDDLNSIGNKNQA
ncbi:lysostaphin resistance A-like protein [Ferruginibacter sp.]